MICSGCQRTACPIDNYNFKTCSNGHTFCINCCSDTLNYCPICLTKIDNQQYKFFYENPPRIVQIHLPIENDENQSDYSEYFNRKIINDNDDGDYDTESEIKSIKCRQRNINECNYNQNSYMPTLTESDINVHSSVKSCDSCEESNVTIDDFQKIQMYIDNTSKNNFLPNDTKPNSIILQKTSSRNIRRFKSEHIVDETNDLIPREDPKELYYQKQKGTLPSNFDPRAHYYKLFNELNNIQNIYNNKKIQQQQQKAKLKSNEFGDTEINSNKNENKKLSKPILEHLIEYRNSSEYKMPTVINVTKIDSNTILTDSDSFLTTSNCDNKQNSNNNNNNNNNDNNTNSNNKDNIELLWRKNRSINTSLNEKSTENANMFMINKVSKGNYDQFDIDNSSTDNSRHASQMATLINNAAFLLTKREYDFINNNPFHNNNNDDNNNNNNNNNNSNNNNNNNNTNNNNNKNNNNNNKNNNPDMNNNTKNNVESNDHEKCENNNNNNNFVKEVIEDISRDVFVSTESYPKLNPHLSYVQPKLSINNINPDKNVHNSWSSQTHTKQLNELVEIDNKKLSTPTESLGKTISYSYDSSPSAPISLATVHNIDEQNHITTDISMEKSLNNIKKIPNKQSQQPLNNFSTNNNVKITQNLNQNNNNNNIENLKKKKISNENLLKNKDLFFNENYENINKNQKKIVTKLIMSNNNNNNEINVIENIGDKDLGDGSVTTTALPSVSSNKNETVSNDVLSQKNYFPQISKDTFLQQMNENLLVNDNNNNIPQFVPVVLVPNTSLPIFPNSSFSINSHGEQLSKNDVHILNWTIPFNPAITNALNNLNVNYHQNTNNCNDSTQEIHQKTTENSLTNSTNSQMTPLPSHNYFMNLSKQYIAQNNTNTPNKNKNKNESQISTVQSSLNETYSMMSSNQIPTLQTKREFISKTLSTPTDRILSHENSIEVDITSKSMDDTMLAYNYNTSDILTQSSGLTTEKDSNVINYNTPGIKPKSTTTDVYYNFWEPMSPMLNEQVINPSNSVNNNNNKTKNNINLNNNCIGDSEIMPKHYIKNLMQNLKKYLIDSCIIMSISEIKKIIDDELEQLINETTNVCKVNSNIVSENITEAVISEPSPPVPVTPSITTNQQSVTLLDGDDEVVTCATDNLDTDRNFNITLDECYDEQNISLQSLDENLSCITYITACHAYKNTFSNDTVSRYEPPPQFQQIKPYQRVEKNFTLPIIKTATELNIPRSPIICPISTCQKLTFVSDFSKHMKIDHVQIPIESMTPGKCKNLFLDPKIDYYGVNKCQMLYLVTDKLRDLGSSKYKDYLPLLVMTKRVNIEELFEIKVQQSSNMALKATCSFSNNDNFLMIWLTGLCPPEMDLYFTLTAWSRVDTIYNRLVHSGKVYSLRQSQESIHLYNSGQVMLISDEQCNCLTDNGKNLIALQVVVY